MKNELIGAGISLFDLWLFNQHHISFSVFAAIAICGGCFAISNQLKPKKVGKL